MSDETFEDRPATPPDLDDQGVAYFEGVISELEEVGLIPDARELSLITAISQQITHTNSIAAAIREQGMTTTGSMGQIVAHPLIQAHTAAVVALNGLLFKAKDITKDLSAEAKPGQRPPGAQRGPRVVRIGA